MAATIDTLQEKIAELSKTINKIPQNNKVNDLSCLSSESNFQEIYTFDKPTGKRLQILVDNAGVFIGRILYQGQSQNVSIKGLPKKIPLEKIGQFKSFLNEHTFLTLQFNQIVVNGRMRGGIDPMTAFAGGMLAYKALDILNNWLSPQQPTTKIELSGENSNPIIAPQKDGNITITINQPGRDVNAEISTEQAVNRLPQLNSKTTLFIGAVTTTTCVAYGLFWYKTNKARNKIDEFGNTPLHNAVQSGSAEQVESLLNTNSYFSYLTPKANINTQNKDGNTALHLAVIAKNANIVNILIKNGANTYLENNKDETPIGLGWEQKDPAIGKALGIKIEEVRPM